MEASLCYHKLALLSTLTWSSLLGVAVSITITWEGILTCVLWSLPSAGLADLFEYSVFLYGLTDGGPSGLIYGYIFSWIGYLAMVSSVGELVSM